MVGFVFGFPGILDGETIIHSDMLGISPAYRSNNLGYLLKCAQRDAAIALGVKRITWTFDPLQSRNAHFNFSKLGVIADRYYIDYYGVTSSFLHRFGTDRLWVTWRLENERVESQPSDLEELPHLVRVGENLEPILNAEPITGSRVLIEIPRELDEHHKLWRMATRAAFTRALDQGFVVKRFFKGKYFLTADERG
jgi:predicted GNAT superfamily acetyltransferase